MRICLKLVISVALLLEILPGLALANGVDDDGDGFIDEGIVVLELEGIDGSKERLVVKGVANPEVFMDRLLEELVDEYGDMAVIEQHFNSEGTVIFIEFNSEGTVIYIEYFSSGGQMMLQPGDIFEMGGGLALQPGDIFEMGGGLALQPGDIFEMGGGSNVQ